MQDIKSTEKTNEQEITTYVPPQIKVYKEEELLQTVAVLGCSPNPF